MWFTVMMLVAHAQPVEERTSGPRSSKDEPAVVVGEGASAPTETPAWGVPVYFVEQQPPTDHRGRPIPRPRRQGSKFLVGVAAVVSAVTLGAVVTTAGDRRVARF